MTRGEVNVVDVGMPFDGHAQEAGVEVHTVFESADDECDVAQSSMGSWSLVRHNDSLSGCNDLVVVGNFQAAAFQHDRCRAVFFGVKRYSTCYFCFV